MEEATQHPRSSMDAGPPPKLAHGFQLGAVVVAHGLQAAYLNGVRGRVTGIKGERVAMEFLEPYGKKALRPANSLQLADEAREEVKPADEACVEAAPACSETDEACVEASGEASRRSLRGSLLQPAVPRHRRTEKR